MISAEKILECLGKPAVEPGVRQMLAELGLPSELPDIEEIDDLEAPDHGVAIFFMTAYHLRNQLMAAGLSEDMPVVSQVTFYAGGLHGEPGFVGALPYALTFSDSRASVRARRGEPSWTSPIGVPNDRWTLGERFLTIDFSKDESRIKAVTCGLSWLL